MAELWNEYGDLTDGWNEQSWVTQTWTAAGDLTDGWTAMAGFETPDPVSVTFGGEAATIGGEDVTW